MTFFQAIILGLVQGVTEFLPISSQAHLYLVPYFFGWDYQGLNFDIALHGGTLLAVLLVFGKEYWKIILAMVRPLPQPLPRPGEGGQGQGEVERKLAWYLVLGSIPAAVAGFFLKEYAETSFRDPFIMIFTLAGFGIFLWWADKRTSNLSSSSSPSPGEEGKLLSWKKALGIGVAQAIAIIPGVSRSGATITAGLFSGLDRQQATRFSFLLSGPVIFGAFFYALFEMNSISSSHVIGFVASAVSGVLAIKFLLKYLLTKGFAIFVWYRIVFAGIIILTLIF